MRENRGLGRHAFKVSWLLLYVTLGAYYVCFSTNLSHFIISFMYPWGWQRKYRKIMKLSFRHTKKGYVAFLGFKYNWESYSFIWSIQPLYVPYATGFLFLIRNAIPSVWNTYLIISPILPIFQHKYHLFL